MLSLLALGGWMMLRRRRK
ncbi:MAG: PEP-CTERM sorting domain-containing protein [Phycisphaerales bacterium]|nr:PEP-CTERM sorting domain-containing protein [Phycisphaerales bacterium]